MYVVRNKHTFLNMLKLIYVYSWHARENRTREKNHWMQQHYYYARVTKISQIQQCLNYWNACMCQCCCWPFEILEPTHFEKNWVLFYKSQWVFLSEIRQCILSREKLCFLMFWRTHHNFVCASSLQSFA